MRVMNRSVIPEHIAEQVNSSRFQGEFPAATLFLDISGFTPLTSALMKHGKTGAELISKTLNGVFGPMIDAVYEHGGFVSVFAGDAFTAIFPAVTEEDHSGGAQADTSGQHQAQSTGVDGADQDGETVKDTSAAVARAARAGMQCRSIINREHLQHTPYGEFSLEASIGIGEGMVEWGVVGPQEKQWSWYFRGPGIDSAVSSEALAGKGEMIVLGRPVRELGEDFAAGTDTEDAGAGRYSEVPMDAVQARFRPLEDLPVEHSGEFRDVVSAFISADAGETWEEVQSTVSCVISAASEFGGYFDVLDFGDKGCVMLVLFGAPRSRGRDSERAAGFARDVISSLGDRGRVGLSRGMVFTGYIGSSHRGTYTAIGSQVNLAARIALSADSATAYTDGKLAHTLGAGATAAEAEERSLKGIDTPVSVYRLNTEVTSGTEITDPQNSEGSVNEEAIPLVGRRAELEKMETWFSEHLRRDAPTLTVIEVHGEAGIGKTMLVNEAVNTISEEMSHISLHADPILRKSLNLFSDLVPAVSRLLGVDLPDTETDDTEATAEWIDRIQTLAHSIDQALAHRLSDTADALPVLIGRTAGEEYMKREPRARLEMTVEAIIEMVRLAAASKGTLVVTADDLQVVDEDSLNALERLLFAAVHDPIVVVGLFRDDDTETGDRLRAPGEATSHMLRLSGMERSALIELSTRVLKGPADASMADFLASRVGANPFYATEMLRYLAGTGHVRNGPRGYEPVHTDTGIPESISSILVERLDSMPAGVRRVSHIAALIGLEFEVSLLDAIINDVDIESALEGGVEARLWSRIDDHTFQFTQTLIRDAIVSMQLDSERRSLHSAILEALKAQYGDDPARAAELAYHAEESGDSALAGLYLWQAFEFAKENFKNAKAVDFLYRYLRQCTSHLQRLTAYIELGNIYELTGDWDSAADALTYALGVSLLARRIRERITVLTSLSQIYQRLGRAREAVEVASHAVEYAEEEQQRYGLAEALLALGRAHWSEGKLDEAETRMTRSVKVATERGDGKTEGLALYHSGVIRRDRNDFAGALRLYKKAEEKLTKHADSQLATFPVYDMAVLLQYEGDLETSQQYFERVLEVYTKTGYRSGASAAVLNLGVLRDRRGDFDGAIEYFEQAREIAESIGEQLAIAYTLFSLGATYYKMFENRKALSYLKDSLRLMRDLGAKGYYPFPLSYLAALYARAGDIDRVISMCSYHMAVVRDLGSDPENGLALLSLARTLAKKGAESASEALRARLDELGDYYGVNPENPDTLFRKAISLSREAQYVNTLIPAHYHYSRYLDEHGDKQQAHSHLAEAYRLAKSATWERFIRTLESRHEMRLLQPDSQKEGSLSVEEPAPAG